MSSQSSAGRDMPKKKRNCKKKEKTRTSLTPCADITVNDFANSDTQQTFRPKKTSMKKVVDEVKSLETKEDEKAWDEKDDDELVSGGVETNNNNFVQRAGRKKKTSNEISDDGEGINYPLDFWFMISEYIRPEDVGRFTAICQATFYVTTTARFWFTVYRRHCKWVAGLPEELVHWNMNYTKGLRAAVIRSLFYMYTPFSTHIAAEKPLTADPTQLLRSQCPRQNRNYLRSRRNNNKQDSLVNFNPENGCYILEATSSAMCGEAMVIGEYLHHAGLGVTSNMCNHRLRLSFVPEHLLSSTSSGTSRKYQVPTTEIILEPVRDVRVYPWWHPQYWKCEHDS
ncbi:Transmembrane protein 183-like [Homarus americanus]|uniref:Transmembrane protein 183-like n=1 Tax=Homarus americanus TaxID=6706 RepID=A0A8J5JLL3_HOMAM|nr:Transmembrane protein 183-like [Homarus americanus]